MDTQLELFPQPAPRLVALAGRAGSGKSLASKTLIEQGWQRVKFADGLKNMLRSLYLTVGLPVAEIERRIEGDLKETPDPLLKDQTPRWAMQTIGNEWGRELIHRDLWTSLAIKTMTNTLASGKNVIVDDCRYQNEVDLIHSLGGKVYMIDRPVPLEEGFEREVHESERFDFEPADAVIYNTGTEQDLQDAIRELCL